VEILPTNNHLFAAVYEVTKTAKIETNSLTKYTIMNIFIQNYYYYIRLMAFSPGQPGKWHQKVKPFWMLMKR